MSSAGKNVARVSVLATLVVAALGAVRHSVVRLETQFMHGRETIVLKRGIRHGLGLLGSDDVLVDEGFGVTDSAYNEQAASVLRAGEPMLRSGAESLLQAAIVEAVARRRM